MDEKQNNIKIIDKSGTEKEYAILSTFDYKDKKFIIYTDYSMDDTNNIKIYSGIYENEGKIVPITKREDEMVALNFIKYIEKGLKDNTLLG